MSPAARLEKKLVDVEGLEMAYADAGGGSGEPAFVLLHGNPTSSFLWRDVIPPLTGLGRCLAPDLIGMGDSAKLPESGPDAYTFVEHRRYLDGLLGAVGLPERVVLVVHDWGSALGFDWARRNPERVAGIAYMEAVVQPVTWDEWPEAARNAFQRMRSPEGEELILENNFFVERILPASILRDLSESEMDEYRRPFAEPGEGRRPTLTWPRQIPIDGEPADVVKIVEDYAEWLSSSPVPKLFVNAEPGVILTGSQREACRQWPNQAEVTVPGLHFIQEDSGEQIGAAVAAWAIEAGLA
jgi:haloalkane dehalogenase